MRASPYLAHALIVPLGGQWLLLTQHRYLKVRYARGQYPSFVYLSDVLEETDALRWFCKWFVLYQCSDSGGAIPLMNSLDYQYQQGELFFLFVRVPQPGK